MFSSHTSPLKMSSYLFHFLKIYRKFSLQSRKTFRHRCENLLALFNNISKRHHRRHKIENILCKLPFQNFYRYVPDESELFIAKIPDTMQAASLLTQLCFFSLQSNLKTSKCFEELGFSFLRAVVWDICSYSKLYKSKRFPQHDILFLNNTASHAWFKTLAGRITT